MTMRQLTIDGCTIADNSDCYVIAEIGHNHQGDLKKAIEMLQAAKWCGVQAVKLQKRDNRSLYTKAMFDQPYEHRNSYGPTYGLHREALEFGKSEYAELIAQAKALGLTFFATAFDAPSVAFLEQFDLPCYKVASCDLINTPLLKLLAQTGKPIILSTGGASMDDVVRGYETVAAINPQVAILQCTSGYPVEAEDMHLRVIESFRQRFPEAVIGLSDHQNGIAMAMVAYILGARIIEKHFTLNRAWKGTDQAFSLEPAGMRKLVRDLQRAKVALGSPEKRRLPIEEEPMKKMGKKLVAARDLPAGQVLRAADVAVKSPGDGLPPYQLEQFLGRRLRQPLAADQNLTFEALEA